MQMGKIGILDSSFAGLVPFRSVVERLPLHNYVYLACGVNDQAAEKGMNKLLAEGCKLIIVPDARLFWHLKPSIATSILFGSATPLAKIAIGRTRNNKIGIIAPNGTKDAELYAAEIMRLEPAVHLYQQACPLLVPLIEAGQQHSHALEAVLHGYLAPLLSGGIDVLALCSSHYDLIQNAIKQLVGPTIQVVGQGLAIATELADYLARHEELEKSMGKQQLRQFYSVPEAKKAFDVMAREYSGSAVSATEITL